jgi:2-octaprenyl-6-methoxyphenol hydroxylase
VTTASESSARHVPGECDIAILGAGPTGLALALALREGPWSVVVFDAAPAASAASAEADPRALALSAGSRQLLSRIDAWPAATAIRNIDISQSGGRTSTGLYAESLGLDALGYVVSYGELLTTLRRRANANGITIAAGHRALAVESHGERALIRFEHGQTVNARLVVHAEGTPHDDSWRLDYGQCAIVCDATPTLPHHHLAYERFTTDGPLALLPLADHYAVVRVVPAARRAELLALDGRAFADDLTSRLGHRVAFSEVGPRRAFPLALSLRWLCHRGREVWIGNAAQTLHPVSGQGFNLGLRDAWTLAEALCEAGPAQPGDVRLDETMLAAWARSRQADRLATTAFTDGIVRLFSNDLAPLHQVREIGLSLLNLAPGLGNFIARRMIWGARGW